MRFPSNGASGKVMKRATKKSRSSVRGGTNRRRIL